MDECYNDDIEIRRCPSKRHSNQLLFGRIMRKKSPERTTSLNVRENNTKRLPVARNISSPSTMQYANDHWYVFSVFSIQFYSTIRMIYVLGNEFHQQENGERCQCSYLTLTGLKAAKIFNSFIFILILFDLDDAPITLLFEDNFSLFIFFFCFIIIQSIAHRIDNASFRFPSIHQPFVSEAQK